MPAPPAFSELSLPGALAAVLGVYFSPEIVPFVSTYSVIILGWFAGLLIGLARRTPNGYRYPIAGYGVVSFIASIGVTVPMAGWLADNMQWLTGVQPQVLLLPVAAAIPAVGQNWFDLFDVVIERVRRLWGSRDKSGGGE